MATAAKRGPQDLPPKGGYGPIQIERIPLRTVIGGWRGIALFCIATAGGLYLHGRDYYRIKKEEIEMRSSRFAILPLLMAERDRSLLKQLRRNREEEEQLMKHIPTWEVGTFFGEPIYHTVNNDEYVEPTLSETIVHSDPKSYMVYLFDYLFA